MKLCRILIPFVLIGLLLFSDYTLVVSLNKENKEYKAVLSKARQYAEKEITKYAIENYNKALQIKDSVEVRAEVAEYYKSQELVNTFRVWCKKFYEDYPKEPKAIDYMLHIYMDQKDYASCYDILESAHKRRATSSYIKEVTEKIAYSYKMDFITYDDVGMFRNNNCPVFKKDGWGFINAIGEETASLKYAWVGAYSEASCAPVVDTNGNCYYVDSEGEKVLPASTAYQCFYPLEDKILAAQKKDGTYTYLDTNYEVLFGDYDFASTMYQDIAVVKKQEKWSIIDSKGDPVTKNTYEDVKLDEAYIANTNDRLFVKSGDTYSMVDTSGKQIGNEVFEDARVFAGETYAAVMIDGKWGFIDKDGKVVIKPEYEEARSFSNGLAAVKVDGKWGFINEKNVMCIEPKFEDAKDFSNHGTCFIKEMNKWKLLKLYRLNRED